MTFGLSGTAAFGRSGTECSDYREPARPAKPQNCWARAPLNYPNMESDGFLLTAQRLWKSGSHRPPALPQSPLEGEQPLTRVTLSWREGKAEDWLRFGKPVAERIRDRHSRAEFYAPGQVFGLVRWASNDYGTIRSTLDVVQAVGPGEACTTLPQVAPGGAILLSVKGWPKVRQILGLIDAIDAAGIDPCEVAPDHWRHMHNRLAAGMAPRAYTAKRHQVWLRRRRLLP